MLCYTRCFLLVVMLSVISNDIQAQWKKVFLTTSKDLYDVQILGNIVYAGGNSGTLIKSADTGKSWKNLTLAFPTNLRALYFLDSSLGFVIGENARIQKTKDGGKTWSTKYIRTAAYGYGIAFHGSRGVAVGKDMLAVSTADSGENWTVDTTIMKGKSLNSVTIMPDGKCWAVGDTGYILKKNITDRKWQVTKYPSKINFNHISHVGGNVIIIAGGMPDSAIVGRFYNILLISNDTGNTWQQNTIGEMKIIYSAWFKNKDTGYLAGSNGLISKCRDGVSERGLQLTGVASSLNSITFLGNIGLVVGDGGTLLRTTNNGGNILPVIGIKDKLRLTAIVPNPCTSDFSIHGDFGASEVTVLGSDGRIIYCDKAYTCGKIISIAEWGIYSVIIKGRDGISSVHRLLSFPY